MSARSVEGAVTAPSAVAFARRGGVWLAFRTAGREDAPAAVLVPGFASHVDVLWDDAGPRVFHERLAARLRLVVYDRRGQGRSSAAAPPTVDADAADLGAILDAAGIERAVVVGQSQGGAAAIAFGGYGAPSGSAGSPSSAPTPAPPPATGIRTGRNASSCSGSRAQSRTRGAIRSWLARSPRALRTTPLSPPGGPAPAAWP